jgi:hypothetical protein
MEEIMGFFTGLGIGLLVLVFVYIQYLRPIIRKNDERIDSLQSDYNNQSGSLKQFRSINEAVLAFILTGHSRKIDESSLQALSALAMLADVETEVTTYYSVGISKVLKPFLFAANAITGCKQQLAELALEIGKNGFNRELELLGESLMHAEEVLAQNDVKFDLKSISNAAAAYKTEHQKAIVRNTYMACQDAYATFVNKAVDLDALAKESDIDLAKEFEGFSGSGFMEAMIAILGS